MIESFQAVLELRLLRAVGINFLVGLMLGYTGWGGAMASMPLLAFLFGPIEALAWTPHNTAPMGWWGFGCLVVYAGARGNIQKILACCTCMPGRFCRNFLN